jgi:hypothetical protein
MWPGIPVVPAMSTGATDSRFLRNIGMPVYGVLGLLWSPRLPRARPDERITQPALYTGRSSSTGW